MIIWLLVACTSAPEPSAAPDGCVPEPELPWDGIDQDCDGADLVDYDGDGVAWPEDCDDVAPDVYPGAEEVPWDGIDQDCDGVDLLDADGDGSPLDEDCDDTDPALNWQDADNDAWPTCLGDCDDADRAVYPAAPRQCGVYADANCDGVDDCDGAHGKRQLPYDADAVFVPAGVQVGTSVGDIDGDGADELGDHDLLGGLQYYRLPVYGEVHPDDAFAVIEIDANAAWYADIDGDGREEVAIDTYGTYETMVFDGLEAGGRFTRDDSLMVLRHSAVDIIPGMIDIDGDGVVEVVMGSFDWGFVTIQPGEHHVDDGIVTINRGDWTAERRSNPHDLTGDGVADLLFGGEYPFDDTLHAVLVEAPVAPGAYVVHDFPETEHFLQSTGDWNGDGSLDILASDSLVGGHYLVPGPIRSDGGTAPQFAEFENLFGGPLGSKVMTSSLEESIDFDGDGFDDIVFSLGDQLEWDVPHSDTYRATLGVFYGPFEGTVPIDINSDMLVIQSQGQTMGMAFAKDVDGDGDDELALHRVEFGSAILYGQPRP
ncbi:MAG: hypothetical protein ACI8PZ_007197 [Myxococcota bacterium]